MGFIEVFEKKVKNTVKNFNLIKKNEKLIVACSGGKDSTTALYLLYKFGYNVEALFIDVGIPDSSNKNLINLRAFCNEHNIKLNIAVLKEEIGDSLVELHKKIKNMSPCAVCGVIKRHYLTLKARELGADKLVTGHNLDDEAENILLNVFGGNLSISLGLSPISGTIKNKKFIPRIKPLYYCTNSETRKYTEMKGFNVLYCNCPLSAFVFRRRIRAIIQELEKNEKKIKLNIVNNFLKLLPSLRKKHAEGLKINYCAECGEPSRNEICKKCELVKKNK